MIPLPYILMQSLTPDFESNIIDNFNQTMKHVYVYLTIYIFIEKQCDADYSL